MVDEMLRQLHKEYLPCTAGEIMERTRGEKGHFALAATSVNGTPCTVGDCEETFTLQSLAKPLVYAAALNLLGEKRVAKRVSVRPSREQFNAIELEEGTGRPPNAMLNAGAIAVTALILEEFGDEAWTIIHDAICKTAGDELPVDDGIYRAERAAAHRHAAMGYLMRSLGVLKVDVEKTLDLYIRQCSIVVNCRQLSFVAATLANAGVNPGTKEKVFKPEVVQDVLSVMLTCGMYDSSGDWAVRVGIPAKSGVAGGLIGIVNRQLGIATYSPPLDSAGHSIRGMKTFSDISRRYALHIFHQNNHGSDFLHSEFGE